MGGVISLALVSRVEWTIHLQLVADPFATNELPTARFHSRPFPFKWLRHMPPRKIKLPLTQ